MTAVRTPIQWDGAVPTLAANTLAAPEGLVVCATRNRNKPGVVLFSAWSSSGNWAELDDEILAFYQMHCDDDILARLTVTGITSMCAKR
jgi:hypothetical protein